MFRVERTTIRVLALGASLGLLVPRAWAGAGVSPGGERSLVVRDACPTFSWAPAKEAGTELRVWRLDPHAEPAAKATLRKTFPAGATSWTPSRDECLAPGRYAWTVRSGDEAWAPRLLFEVPAEMSLSAAPVGPTSEAPPPSEADSHQRPLAGGPEADAAELKVPAALTAFQPPACVAGQEVFADVPASHPFCAWIQQLYGDAVTGGCGVDPPRYCKDDPLTRGQMAVFLERAMRGTATWTPGDVTGVTAGTGLTGGGAAGELGLSVDFAGSGASTTVARSDHSHPADITGVTAGTGLTGGGAAGELSLSVDFAGSGASTTVARSDHDHFGQLWQGTAEKGLEVSNAGNYGVYGTGSYTGVWGSGSSYGVYGAATANGVKGSGDTNGVFGETTGGTGVRGAAYGGAAGVFSNYNTGNAVYLADASRAAWFAGNVHVAGTLSKDAGSFKIDHPLDPENKYLSHSFVESPDMMNVYNGNAVLDRRGEAVIELPDWFEALNRDFRYQLTPLGVPQPGLFVAEKVQGNRFRIGGGVPGAEVSWQVTGIRHDAYAEAHRIQVEEEKRDGERGFYLFPEGFGAPKERSISPARVSGRAAPATRGGALPKEEEPSLHN